MEFGSFMVIASELSSTERCLFVCGKCLFVCGKSNLAELDGSMFCLTIALQQFGGFSSNLADVSKVFHVPVLYLQCANLAFRHRTNAMKNCGGL